MVSAPMLSAAQIASMRATSDAALPDVCEIQRVTKTPDGAGGWTDAWATLAVLPCRVSTTGGPERVIASKLDALTTATFSFPAGTDCIAADRILINGQTFEVQAAPNPQSWEIAQRVVAVEIK